MKNKAIKIKRALLSVSDKAGIVDLAKTLELLEVEIISTGGTLKVLEEKGIKVKDISEFSGSSEMMQGRVKTLHPKVHGGILSRRDLDSEEVKKNKIEEIDLVVVNLYPFEETTAKDDVTVDEAIENIDIGGPTMIRAAAKNFFHVAVISSPHLYEDFSKELLKTNECSYQTRLNLAGEAFNLVTEYDQAISNYFEKKDTVDFPKILFGQFKKTENLRYGENPHQEAAFYKHISQTSAGITSSEQIQGKELSYNNIADTDAAIECVSNFKEPTCVIVKHANPCGVASSTTALDAYKKAFACDPTSAFGGIISFNTEVDEGVASFMIDNQFIEVIAAPNYSVDALKVLTSKKNLRVLKIDNLKTISSGVKLHTVNSGLLVQSIDSGSITSNDLKIVSKKLPSEEEIRNSLFAWSVCKYVKSNAIIYANDNKTLGIGAGQMSRIDSAEIAVKKAKIAGFSLEGACMASDAFFPFRDSIDEAAKNGISCIIQPGGSIRDEEVIQAANEANMIMMFTGMRHFRH